MRYVALVLALGALAFAGTASASKPDMMRIEVADTHTTDCGGHQITHTITGFIIVRDFFRNGEFVGSITSYALMSESTTYGWRATAPPPWRSSASSADSSCQARGSFSARSVKYGCSSRTRTTPSRM